MATFGITPVTGFPPVTDEGFPRFIQFQVDGNDVGGRSVENVNFIGDVSGTVSSDGSTATFDIGVPGVNWTDVPGDYTLTDDDVEQIRGERDQLVGRVQQRYGRARNDAEREVAEWEQRMSDRFANRGMDRR